MQRGVVNVGIATTPFVLSGAYDGFLARATRQFGFAKPLFGRGDLCIGAARVFPVDDDRLAKLL